MSVPAANRSRRPGPVIRRLAGLMLFEAATLAVASGLHLSGSVHGTSPYDPDHAGIAEAVIGAVLVAGAVAMLRSPSRARSVGLTTTGFAIVGFLVGLSFTIQGGHAPDVAYHLVVLPILVASVVVLARLPVDSPPVQGGSDDRQLTRSGA